MSVKLATREYVDNRRAVLSVNLPLAVAKQNYTNSILFANAKKITIFVVDSIAYSSEFSLLGDITTYTTNEHTIEFNSATKTLIYSTNAWQVTNRAPVIRKIIVEY